MRKDKILGKPALGALQLRFSRNEPVDKSDYSAPDLHFYAPRWTYVAAKLSAVAFKNRFRFASSGINAVLS
jgi:hypothetical protein